MVGEGEIAGAVGRDGGGVPPRGQRRQQVHGHDAAPPEGEGRGPDGAPPVPSLCRRERPPPRPHRPPRAPLARVHYRLDAVRMIKMESCRGPKQRHQCKNLAHGGADMIEKPKSGKRRNPL